MSKHEEESTERIPAKRMKRELVLPIVSNVKVKYLRPRYNNLKDWMADRDNVYIGRAGVVFVDGKRFPGKQSVWANPFKIGRDGSRDKVIQKYEDYIVAKLEAEPELKEELKTFQGKNLGCWCVDSPTSSCESGMVCHGQVLIKVLKNMSTSN